MNYQALLDRCPHVSTEGMSYEEWLEKRRGSIGGSDAGAIMGLNNYASPLTVYLQKQGLVPSKEMSRAAQRGKLLEPVIRDNLVKEFPALSVSCVPYMFYSPEHPGMSANIDGVIFVGTSISIAGKELSGLGGLEVKSSKTGYGFGNDEIPDAYYAQVQHYMAVLGLSWFVLAVCFLETEEIAYYVIERNDRFIADLIQQEKDFWENYVVPGVMPAAIGIEAEEGMITGMFEGSQAPIVLGEKESALCGEYDELNKAIKGMEQRKDAIAADLKAILVQQATGNPKEKKVSAKAGRYSISWSRFETKRVDTDALKKAGLYDRYAKTTESGRFLVTEKKEA